MITARDTVQAEADGHIAIRVARDEDGPAIGKLYRDADWPDHGVDWTRGIGGWWLVGERDGEIVGAAQVICSRPFGYIGDIIVHPHERGKGADGVGRLGLRAGALAKTLFLHAHVLMERAGVQILMGVVEDRLMPTLGRRMLMVEYGGSDLGAFHFLAKRIG